MTACLIVSAMADDRPGLVESLSSAIKDNNGNWLESRMAHMAGKFAGIVRIQVPASHQESLKAALNGLSDQGWTISIEDINAQATTESGQKLSVSIVGNDRPGIVQEVSAVLAAQGVNVLELNTHYESAAMSAEPLFKAVAKVLMPSGIDADDVIDRLENISNDLMVETQSAD
jgi:glycine cleavage system regulatory protein